MLGSDTEPLVGHEFGFPLGDSDRPLEIELRGRDGAVRAAEMRADPGRYGVRGRLGGRRARRDRSGRGRPRPARGRAAARRRAGRDLPRAAQPPDRAHAGLAGAGRHLGGAARHPAAGAAAPHQPPDLPHQRHRQPGARRRPDGRRPLPSRAPAGAAARPRARRPARPRRAARDPADRRRRAGLHRDGPRARLDGRVEPAGQRRHPRPPRSRGRHGQHGRGVDDPRRLRPGPGCRRPTGSGSSTATPGWTCPPRRARVSGCGSSSRSSRLTVGRCGASPRSPPGLASCAASRPEATTIGPTTSPDPGSLRSASLLTDPVLQAMAVGVAVVRVSDLTVVDSNPAWRALFSATDDPQVLYSPADATRRPRPDRSGAASPATATGSGTVRARGATALLVPAHRRAGPRRGPPRGVGDDRHRRHRRARRGRRGPQRHRPAALRGGRAAAGARLQGRVPHRGLPRPADPPDRGAGFVDLLRTGRVRSDPAGLKSMLDRMATSLQDMTLLVDRLLYWGMLQSGTASIAPRPLRLADEVGAVVTQLGDLLRDRDVRTDVPATSSPSSTRWRWSGCWSSSRQRREVLRPRQPVFVAARAVEPEATAGTRCPRWWSRSPTRAAACGRTGWPRSTSASTPATDPPAVGTTSGLGPRDRAALRRPARRPGAPRQPAAPGHDRVVHPAGSTPPG